MCRGCAREEALLAMYVKAKSMGLHGTAIAFTSHIRAPEGPDFWEMTALPVGDVADPAEKTADWSVTGANYFGIASGKLAQTIRTGALFSVSEDQQGALSPVGEFAYRGCAVYEHEPSGTLVRLAFSGGTEDEDMIVAGEGLTTIARALDYLVSDSESEVGVRVLVVRSVPETKGRKRRSKH